MKVYKTNVRWQDVPIWQKYFTKGCLRIDSFQSCCLFGQNDAIMGYFDKSLNINTLHL